MRIKSLLVALVFLISSNVFAQDVFNGCGMEGDTKVARIKQLNLLKNRYNFPKTGDFNQKITLKAMLAPGDDADRWRETQAAEIVGYVHDVIKGAVETVNCNSKDPYYRDTHIELILDPDHDEKTERVIVEVTPRLRKIMEDKGVDWTTSGIKEAFKGKWVKIKGWMFFDAEHLYQSENTNPGEEKNWRATAWEIHPVTSIDVVDKPKQK